MIDPWRIVVVDDNPADLAEAKAALLRGSTRRYTFLAGSTVAEAVALCAADPRPDCAVLDFSLRDGTVLEVLVALAEEGAGRLVLPVVILTGRSGSGESHAVLRAGAQDFVGKSWLTPESLTRAVENAVERHAMQHELRQREVQFRTLAEQLLTAERAARGEVERVARIKDEFLTTLSHELRTPLNAIVGWAQVLQRSPPGPETLARGIEAIARNAHAQSQLIQDLLETSRIVSGKLRLEVGALDLNLVAASAADSVRPAAEAKGIRLDLRLALDLPRISGDAVRLQQAVDNLLGNALKFTPPGGRVEVATRLEGERAVLAVADDGQGIEAAFMPYLFDRFSQADGSAARRHGGLGLGLSIVKQLVEMHGGVVSAASDGAGRGTRFEIALPLGATARQSPFSASGVGEPGAETGAEIDLTGLSILVVDDQEDALELARRLLAEQGAAVTTATSGDDALRQLSAACPHVLVSDVGMSAMDGYRLIGEVRGRLGLSATVLPAVALTAFSRSEDRERALSAGFQAHLAKPVEPHVLLATVLELAGARGKNHLEAISSSSSPCLESTSSSKELAT